MNTQTLEPQSTVEVIHEGWQTLVEHLGVSKATRFVRSFSPGIGDSVKECREMWEGMSVDDIHEKIMEAKKRGEI